MDPELLEQVMAAMAPTLRTIQIEQAKNHVLQAAATIFASNAVSDASAAVKVALELADRVEAEFQAAAVQTSAL